MHKACLSLLLESEGGWQLLLIKCLKSEKGDKDAGLMRLGTQFYLCGGGEVPPSREELSRVDTVAGRGAAVRWGGGGLSGGQHKWAGERGTDQLYHDQLGRVTQDWIDCLTSNLKQFIICRNFISSPNQLTWKATMLVNFKFHGRKVLPGVKQNCGRQFAHCKYCICNTLHQFYTYVKVYKSCYTVYFS